MEDESSRGRVQGQEVHKPRIEHLSGFSDRSARGLRVRDSRLDKLSKQSEQQMDNQAIKQFYELLSLCKEKVGEAQKLEAEIILVGNFPQQLNFPFLYELQYQIVVQIGAQRKYLRRGNFFTSRVHLNPTISTQVKYFALLRNIHSCLNLVIFWGFILSRCMRLIWVLPMVRWLERSSTIAPDGAGENGVVGVPPGPVPTAVGVLLARRVVTAPWRIWEAVDNSAVD